MNDPFAMLNPIDKPKTAPVYGGPPAAPVAPLHHPVGQGFGGPPGMGMNMGMAMNMGMGGGMPSGMGMTMGGMGHPGMGPPGMGPSGMGHPGMVHPGMGHPGMAPGMRHPGMGMGPPPGGMPPQQAPIMYDNIKNLLEQKAKPSGAMRDDAGMDFLENLGSGKAHSLSVSSPTASVALDPFGGPAASPSSSTTTTTTTPVSPSGGAKSSALADRLANGRRKTQEMQRQQLGINAGAFSQTSAPKISLKDMVPSPSSGDRGSRAPSLEDFASGKQVFQESDPFGISSGGSSSRTGSGGSHNQPKPTKPTYSHTEISSAFNPDGGVILADSDADFEKKLNSGGSMAATGSARQLSSGSLGTSANRTGSGGAAAAKATMDFGW